MMSDDIGKAALDRLKNRYSCRKFKDRPIESDLMDDLLEVGLSAASGGNIQAVSIIRVKSMAQKQRIHEYITREFVLTADTILVYVLDYYRMKRWAEVEKAPFGRQYSYRDYMIEIEDVMCVAQSIECAATLRGIGSVYMGGVNKHYEAFKEILDLPELTVPILVVCMGYPDQGRKEKKKLAKELMVHEEVYKRLTDEEVVTGIVQNKYDAAVHRLEGVALEEKKSEICRCAEVVNGKAWAQEVGKRIDEQGGVNRAQHALGVHYNPIRQHSFNQNIFEFYNAQGLHMLPGDDWFRQSENIGE